MPQYLLALQWRLHTCLQYSLVFAIQLCALFPWYICWPWKLWLEAKTDCLYPQVVCVCFADCLTVCLLLTVCLSGGENVPRARGLCMWGLWRPAKKHCLSSCFIRTRPLHHSQGQRCTHRIVEQRKGQGDAQILIVKTNELRREKILQYNCDNTTSRSCCCQKICSRGFDCRCGKVPLVCTYQQTYACTSVVN